MMPRNKGTLTGEPKKAATNEDKVKIQIARARRFWWQVLRLATKVVIAKSNVVVDNLG